MNEAPWNRAKVSGAVGQAIIEYLNPKEGELTAESVFSNRELSSLVTWICVRTRIPIGQPLPRKMTIREILETFQKAAGV